MTKGSHRSKSSGNTNSTVSHNTVPYSAIQKIKGTEKLYQESIEASSSFNKRLLNERKMRIPFIDSQTKVAQSNNCMLWLSEYQRRASPHLSTSQQTSSSGYVYSYPIKKWYKHRRLVLDAAESHLFRMHHQNQQQHPNNASNVNNVNLSESNNNFGHLNENSNSMDSSSMMQQQHQQSGAAAVSAAQVQSSQMVSENSRIATQAASSGGSGLGGCSRQSTSTAPNDDYETNNANNEWATHHNQVQHHHGHHLSAQGVYADESFENFESFNDNDMDSDHDDYEESGKKKKKKAKPRRKTETLANGEEKVFVCDRCGVKYKTKPGLNYHIQKAHIKNNNTPNSSHSGGSGGGGGGHQVSNATTTSSTSKSNDALNPDENTTNSIFESHGYDDVNSSSSLSQATVANHEKQAASQANKCGICMGNENEGRANFQNPQAPNEKFISCCDCGKLFHPSCLNFNPNMIASVKKYNWQCIECKRCTHCGNSENDDKLLFCDDCDRGFHMYCLKPALNEAPQGDWRCELCVKQFGSST